MSTNWQVHSRRPPLCRSARGFGTFALKRPPLIASVGSIADMRCAEKSNAHRVAMDRSQQQRKQSLRFLRNATKNLSGGLRENRSWRLPMMGKVQSGEESGSLTSEKACSGCRRRLSTRSSACYPLAFPQKSLESPAISVSAITDAQRPLFYPYTGT
jgi:hypothetical protein